MRLSFDLVATQPVIRNTLAEQETTPQVPRSKRRAGSLSPSTGKVKCTISYSQQPHEADRNPFQVRASTSPTSGQDLERRRPVVRTDWHIRPTPMLDPQTPPALRSRIRQQDVQTSHQAPMDCDSAPSSPLHQRKPTVDTDSYHRDEYGSRTTAAPTTPTYSQRYSQRMAPAAERVLIPGTPAEALERQDTINSSAIQPQHPSPKINPEETPPRSERRTLIAEFLGVAKTDDLYAESTSLKAMTTPTQPYRNRRHGFMEIDSPTSMAFTVPSSQLMQKVPNPTGSPIAGRVHSPSESPSSETRIQWTQSLETPPKKRLSSGAVPTSRNNIINKLRGLPEHASEKVTAPGEFVGWSPSMETPPRQAVTITETQGVVRENILEKLRGLPQSTPYLDDGRLSQDSQEDHYYSAASSIADMQDGYQGELASNVDEDLLNGSPALSSKSESPSMASADIQLTSKDETASDMTSLPESVGLTLPSSLVQELEHDADALEAGSPIVSSQVFSSGQRVTNVLDELQDITPSGMDRHYQDTSPARFSRPLQLHDTAASNAHCFSATDDVSQRESDLRGDVIVAGSTISQDLDNLQLEPWSSPLEENEVSRIGAKRQSADLHHAIQSCHRTFIAPVEEGAHDDFADIRFSQLDDGFDIPDLVQKSQRMSPSYDDDTARLTTGALMLQNGAEDTCHDSASVAPPSLGLTGFARASGKKLAASSRAALARVSDLLESDVDEFGAIRQPNALTSPGIDQGFRSAGGRKLAPISSAALAKATSMLGNMDHQNGSEEAGPQMMTSSESIKEFGSFKSAGGKTLAPISKAAQERAARFLEEDPLKMDASHTMENHLPGITTSTVSAVQIIDGALHSLGGFSSAGGKKLAPISKATLENWSRQLAEDSTTESAIETPFTAHPKPPQTGFTGFASGNGKRLAPVSEAAKARALGVLEVDDSLPVLPATLLNSSEAIAHGISRLSPMLSDRKGYTGAENTASHFKPPAISNHMHKLKLKALRPTSAAPLQPSVHKTAMKVTEPFKSSRPFKPPLKAHSGMSTGTAGCTVAPSSGSSRKERSDTIPDLHDNTPDSTGRVVAEGAASIGTPSGRLSVVKRAALHPNARAAHRSVPLEMPLAPDRVSHHVLFNVRGDGVRISLSTLGSPQHHTAQSLKDIGVSEDVIYMSLDNAKTYNFGNWGVDDAYRDLLSRGATEELFSRTWLENHYAMIVWKLACYVRSWPRHLLAAAAAGSGWFCPSKVLDQLAYRYEREINRAERPAVRKIVEGDESPAKHMVLAIAGIDRTYDEEAKKDVLKVTVTDGWYAIPAKLDACLTRAADRGRLKVGSKVHICQAKLSGAEGGVAIQDVMTGSTAVAIILQGNSTRLAKWDKKLGFQKESVVRTTRLRNIVADGGLVPALDVVVLRKYPVLYMESLENGTKIRRTAREEERAVEEHRDWMQKQYHDMVADVQARFGADADGSMSITQPIVVQDVIRSRAADLEAKAVGRNVVPFFSIRVGDYHCSGSGIDSDGESEHQPEAVITFWHDDHGSCQEGHRVKIMSVMAKKPNREHSQDEKIQLTGTRMSAVVELPTDPEALLLTSYRPREITTCAEVGHLYHGAEFDLAVVVLAVGNWIPGSNKAFFAVTDASRRLLLVEHQMAPHRSALPTFLKCQTKILMANARYKLRDPKLDLDIILSTQNYTHIMAAPVAMAASVSTAPGRATWPSYAQPSLLKLHELMASLQTEGSGRDQSSDDQNSLVDLMAKASTVLTGMQPTMNKHLQQPDSMAASPHHPEQLSNPGKKHAAHGPTTQSTFKTDPNLHSQQHSSDNADAKKQHRNVSKKSSGSHSQKADHK
ncbi:Breast cancer 2, early onset [Mortierella alpina]|nr:Breast cancer 2, early onset [Mortierella alpina]